MKKRMILAIAVALALCLSAPAQAGVVVPDVGGMTADQALKTLLASRLKPSISYATTSNQAQAGKVIKQVPAARAVAELDTVVALTVGVYQAAPVTAPTTKVTVAPAVMDAFGETVMPNVVYMTMAQAKAALEKAGLSYDKATKEYTVNRNRDEQSIAGQIQDQRPKPGTRIAKTTQIWLKGTQYQPPPNVTVPDVRNLSVDDAFAKLKAVNLYPGGGSATTARKELDHKVAEMDPAPGRVVPEGTAVNLTYWLYAESFLEMRVDFMPEAKTYLLLVRGGAQPYDVVVSYDVPKNVKLAPGQKVVTVLLLNDEPAAPAWKRYRITNLVPVEAVMVITDAKGRKHEYKLHLTQANK
jgi:beta-lactam-binding protein with PASTA domain